MSLGTFCSVCVFLIVNPKRAFTREADRKTCRRPVPSGRPTELRKQLLRAARMWIQRRAARMWIRRRAAKVGRTEKRLWPTLNRVATRSTLRDKTPKTRTVRSWLGGRTQIQIGEGVWKWTKRDVSYRVHAVKEIVILLGSGVCRILKFIV